jgi:hypothetical protein
MKSFFKKLSLVLAAAMVITMLPMQSAKAADVIIGERDGNKVTPVAQVEVGYNAEWGFLNVTPYDAAAYNSVKFTSSNKAVAVIGGAKNRNIQAIAAGKTTISFSCTNGKGTTFTAKSELEVVAKGQLKAFELKQTEKDVVIATFGSAADATAAKEKMTVELIKKTKSGQEIKLGSTAKPEVKDNTVVIKNLIPQLTYRVTVGTDSKDIEMTMGKYDSFQVVYGYAYVGKDKNILGSSIISGEVKPEVIVYDENGIIIDRPEYADGNLVFDYDSDVSDDDAFCYGDGTVEFSKAGSKCKVTVTYIYTDANNDEQKDTWTGWVYSTDYVAPAISGWASSIGLTKADKIGKDANYTNKELKVYEDYYLVFKLDGSDGKVYTGYNVSGQAACAESGKQVLTLDASQFDYYFAKAKDDNILSIYEGANSTKITGWSAGTSRIYLYKRVGTTRDTNKDEIVGLIDVTVKAEPKLTYVSLSTSSVDAWQNSMDTTRKVTVTVQDQYKQLFDIAETDIILKDKDGNQVNTGAYDVTEKKAGEYELALYLNQSTVFAADSKSVYTVAVGDKKANLSIGTKTVSTTGTPSYDLVVNDVKVTDKSIINATNVANIVSNIKVVETYSRVAVNAVNFWLVSDDPTSSEALAAIGTSTTPIVVIRNSAKKLVSQDKTNTIGTTAAPTRVGTSGFDFDAFTNVTATSKGKVGDCLLAGTFTATVYQNTANGLRKLSTKNFTISNNIKGIQSVDPTYQLKADGTVNKDAAVWGANETKGVYTVSASTTNALWLDLCARLNCFYDVDGNGSVTKDGGEIRSLKNNATTGLPNFEIVSVDYINGAKSDKEVYVRSITVKYTTAGDVYNQQTITLNKKLLINQ